MEQENSSNESEDDGGFSKLRENSVYTQNTVEVVHMAPLAGFFSILLSFHPILHTRL